MTQLLPPGEAKTARTAAFGASAMYLLIPLTFSVLALPLVSEATRPPLGLADWPRSALTLLAVFIIGVLLPATALLRGIRSLVRPPARVLLAALAFLFTLIWGVIVAWAIGLGASGGNSESAVGMLSVWVLTTSNAWPILVTAGCMALPRGRARLITLAASTGGGLLLLIVALITVRVTAQV